MSGGSYNYAYHHVDNMADSLQQQTPLRAAFAEHLRLVARAMHDIEWVDSGDYGEGREETAIRACLPADAELNAAVERAERARDELTEAIASAVGPHTETSTTDGGQ